MGAMMFNYGGYLNNGGGTGAANPVTGVSAECLTSTTAACRRERLERLFAYLQSKGVTNIELFGHSGFPATADIAGLQAYRALMDTYGLHAGGWHGDMTEANWDARLTAAKILGVDYIGSGGAADPGIATYANTLLTAETLNRLGKRSVEAGVGPAYFHNHQAEFTTQYMHDGVMTTAFDILLDETDPRYVVAEIDVLWASDAFAGHHRHAGRRAHQQVVHARVGSDPGLVAHPAPAHEGRHQHRRSRPTPARVRSAWASSTSGRSWPPRGAGSATTTRSRTAGRSPTPRRASTNLKGINTAVLPAVLGAPPTFQSMRLNQPSPNVPVIDPKHR